MARGLMAYEASMNRHGVPIEQATDQDTEGFWNVRLIRDYADEAVRAFQEKASDSDRHAIPQVWLDPDYTPDARRRKKSAPKPLDDQSGDA